MNKMTRVEAIRQIVSKHPNAAIIFCNGLNSREASFTVDRPGNFYVLHAMGEALSVGIGLLSACPDLEVVVVDGDGNAVMGLSEWTFLPQKNLHYYVLANNSYETTGSQAVPKIKDIPPYVHWIAISEGQINAPNPPNAQAVQERFVEWVKTR